MNDDLDDNINYLAANLFGLPQYSNSLVVNDRFLEAIHSKSRPLDRTSSIKGEIKGVHKSELDLDLLSYFEINCNELSEDFYLELCEIIGESQAELFVDILVNYWFVNGKQNSKKVQGLKSSIFSYLNISGENPAEMISKEIDLKKDTLFTYCEIAKILKLNDEFVYKVIHDWIQLHPESRFLSYDDIFIRRGVKLPNHYHGGGEYREYEYLNSYSLSVTVPEQFTYLGSGEYRSMLSARLTLFNSRILFFSPLIKGMSPSQLEIGVIPSVKPLALIYQGMHSGVDEYFIVDELEPPL